MGLIKRIVLLALTTLLAAGLTVAVIYVQGIPIHEGQAKAAALLGSDTAKYCSNVSKVDNDTVALSGKLVVLNTLDNTLYTDYQNALPASRQPAVPADVTGVLCLTESQTVFDTSYYGENHDYTCTQYQKVLDAYLVDKKSGQVLAYQQFTGPTPPDCPDSTDSSLTETGDRVSPTIVADWLH